MDHVVLLLSCVAPVVWCYSSGQVMDSCEDMRPKHSGLSPQIEPAPFVITTDHSRYTPGEELKVELKSLTSITFIGFLLQAREVEGRSAVGTFTLKTGETRTLNCSRTPDSAVSHRSESVKTSVQVLWTLEASAAIKTIQFHATFVQNYHTFWIDVKSPVLTLTNDSTTIYQHALPTKSISGADCGATKVCLRQPSHCDPTVNANCYFMSAMVMPPRDAAVHYEMTGPSDGYISFGLSHDQMMGDDDIYICGIGTNGLVQLQHAFSIGREAPQLVPLRNVSDVQTAVVNRVISCSFTFSADSTQKTSVFNTTYHLMFAHGPSNDGQIQFHTATFVSTNKVDISRPQLVQTARWPHIIKAHGALMLIAWMTLGSLGMMVARYLKGMAKGQKLCGKDVWFLVHVAAMTLTVAATIIAFILSFSYVKAWSGGAHPVLGCLVMILSFLQPMLALLRCGNQHPKRFLFNWFHALNGVAIKALSVAAIFTGLKLIDSTPAQWMMKVMGGSVAWEALLVILLDIHFKWNNYSPGTLESTMIRVQVLLMALFSLGNLAFLVALLVGIGMS